MNESVLFDLKNKIAVITLNRPEKRNALNRSLLVQLYTAIKRIESDENVAVAVITGKGSAFCSGIDLEAIKTDDFYNFMLEELKLPNIMATCSKPIIGAINGATITGGLEIALSCDFLISAKTAIFADTHAYMGIHPGWGITQLLQQAIGQRRAKQMSFTCQTISAQTAHNWGLINEVVEFNQVVKRSLEIAKGISENKLEFVSSIKRLINNKNKMFFNEALGLEQKGFKKFVQNLK